MPRPAVQDNERMNLRVRPEVKARLVRAAALQQTDLTSFITQASLVAADAVIAAADAVSLSERDHARLMQLLDNPPKANARLTAAIAVLPDSL